MPAVGLEDELAAARAQVTRQRAVIVRQSRQLQDLDQLLHLPGLTAQERVTVALLIVETRLDDVELEVPPLTVEQVRIIATPVNPGLVRGPVQTTPQSGHPC